MKKFFLLAVLLPYLSFAQERIMVISDPHVIPQTEIDKQADFDKYMKTQRKMLELSEPIWHALLDTALKYKPDLVLIPGDLTKDGEAASHDTVSAGLHRLEAAGIRTLVIPGNHDIPGEDWETLYSGTFKDAVKDPGSHSFASEPLPGLTVIGIDGSDGKASIGKLSAATQEWIATQAKAAVAKGNKIIAMSHWQILEHFDGVGSLEPASRYDKPDEVRDLLMHNGVHFVLTGHFHVSGITTYRDMSGLTQDSLVEITTGSPITYPCPYRWITLSKDRKSFELTTDSIRSLAGIDGDFTAYSKEWMREHTSNLVPSLAKRFWGKIMDKWDEEIGPALKASMGSLMESAIKEALPQTEAEQVAITEKYMSEPAINLYLFYSQANESKHPKEGKALAKAMDQGMIDMLDELIGFGAEDFYEMVVKPEINGTIQSLIQDKTMLDTENEDVTDDLELVAGTQETSVVYVVNKLGWEKVYAYVWCEVDEKIYPYKPWPGVEMHQPLSAPAKNKAKKSEEQIYAAEFPQGYYKVIFNNGEALETVEMKWEESKPYFVLSAEKDGEGHYKGDWNTPSDMDAAKAVDDKISAIGTVEFTDASKALIDAARAAYNVLTDGQKALVANLATLEAAEKAYADLKAAAEKAAADAAAAKAVDDKISAIGTVEFTDASKALIDAARAAYNLLTDDQKALVANLAVLEAAEKAYADLKAAASATAIDDIQSSDINIQKVLRNGKVYFLVGEKMYDMTGRLVK